MKHFLGKVGLMLASTSMMSYIAVASVIAQIAEHFPDTPIKTVQMLTAVPGIVSVCASVAVGFITPYVYKKYLLLIAGMIYPVIGVILYFYHPNVMTMLILTAIMGIGNGISVPCIPALIADCYNEKESALLIGMQGGFISGGAMLLSWIVGQIAKDRWENCYLVYLLILVFVVIEAFCLPKGKLDAKAEKNSQKLKVPGSILFYSIIIFFFGIMIQVFNSNISLLVEYRSIGSTLEASYSTSLYNFAGMIAGCVTGYIITKTKHFTYLIALASGIIGMLICFFSNSFIPVCLGGILCGIAFASLVPAANYYATVESSPYNRSFCLSLVNAGNALGLFVSPLLFGSIFGNSSVDIQFLGAGIGQFVLFVIMFIGIFVIRKRTP